MIENTTIEGRTTVTLGYGNVVISTSEYVDGVYLDFKQMIESLPIGRLASNEGNNIEPSPHPSVCIMIDNVEAMQVLIGVIQKATEKLIVKKKREEDERNTR